MPRPYDRQLISDTFGAAVAVTGCVLLELALNSPSTAWYGPRLERTPSLRPYIILNFKIDSI